MKKLKFNLVLLMLLFASSFAYGQVTIFPLASTWRYSANGSNQGTAWYATNFNDSTTAGWVTNATGPLGYRTTTAAPQPTTSVHAAPLVAGSVTQVGYCTYYFRKRFTIPAGTYTSFTLRVRRDDGFAMYINGVRYTSATVRTGPTGVVDGNSFNGYSLMDPATAPLYNTPSQATGDDGSATNVITIPASAFATSTTSATNHVIAVEMHNRPCTSTGLPSYSTSSDIFFDMSLAANTNVPTPLLTRGAYMVCPTYNSAVTGTINTVSGADSITVQSSYISNLAVGMTVAGTGVGANARITGINTATNRIRVSVSSTATVAGVTGTFDSRCLNTVQFRTSLACTGWVKFGASTTTLNTKVTEGTVDNVAPFDHTVVLPTLSPNTKYFYSIGYTQSGIDYTLEATANNYFTTPPVKGDTARTRFWVCGDQGQYDCRNNMTAVKNAFLNYCTTLNIQDKINGWIWLGDNAYNDGTDGEYDTAMFIGVGSFPGMNQQFKSFPVYPAPGNHDYYGNKSQTFDQHTSANNPPYTDGNSAAVGTTSTTNYPYFDIFGIPSVNTATSGTKKYWSQDHGTVHMISLDSYGSIANSYSAPMMVWLRNDLIAARNNPNIKFIIAFWHHPPYSRGGHTSNTSTELVVMRNFVNPLLEKYGVDLVLCGHSHQYERTNFIKGNFLYNADTASGRNQAVPLNTPGLEQDFRPHSYFDSSGTLFVNGFYPSSNEVARPTETRGADSLLSNDSYSKTSSNGTIYIVCGNSGSCDGHTSLCSGSPVDSNNIVPLTSFANATNWHWGQRQWPHNADRMPDQIYGSIGTTFGSTTITVNSTLLRRLVLNTWVQPTSERKGAPVFGLNPNTIITGINLTTNTATISSAATSTNSTLRVRFERPSNKAYTYGFGSTQNGGCSLLLETFFTPSTGKYNLSVTTIQARSSSTSRVLDKFVIIK